MYHIGCDHIGDDAGKSEPREVTLRYKREALLYDIRNYAYIEGHVMDEDAEHARHTLVEVGEEGNVDRVTRILDVVHAGAVEMLYPLTKEETAEGETLSDELEEPDEYAIVLRVPATMSRTTVRLIHKLVHEYMVYRVMYDWLSITNRQAAVSWLERAREAEEEINVIKNSRTGVLTRKAHPF